MEIAVLSALAAAAVGMHAVERFKLDRHRNRIKTRVHVNGTRGKSSVTRLIAAALRGGGLRTVAKTTGTLPRIIYEDGTEVPLYRLGKANIREQFHVMGIAAKRNPDALVIECMALQPLLQDLSERRIVQATIGVITNARPDHLDVMGPTEADVVRALAGTIPYGAPLVTAERDHLELIAACCKERGATLVAVGPDEIEAVSDDLMCAFPYYEHRENVAVALEVARLAGVARPAAEAGLRTVKPDVGALSAHDVDFFGRRLLFVHGFAANDPESSAGLWRMALRTFAELQRRVVVLNLRIDRADRSRQMGELLATLPGVTHAVLMGTGGQIAARAAVAAGFDPLRLVFAEDFSAPEVFEQLVGLVDDEALIVGLGNVADEGLPLVDYFRNRGRPVPMERFYPSGGPAREVTAPYAVAASAAPEPVEAEPEPEPAPA